MAGGFPGAAGIHPLANRAFRFEPQRSWHGRGVPATGCLGQVSTDPFVASSAAIRSSRLGVSRRTSRCVARLAAVGGALHLGRWPSTRRQDGRRSGRVVGYLTGRADRGLAGIARTAPPRYPGRGSRLLYRRGHGRRQRSGWRDRSCFLWRNGARRAV